MTWSGERLVASRGQLDRLDTAAREDLEESTGVQRISVVNQVSEVGERVGQAKRSTAELFAEAPILLSQIVDQILLVAVQPSSEGEDEELQSRGHRPRLRRSDDARSGPARRFGGLGRLFAPYELRDTATTICPLASRASPKPFIDLRP